MSFSCDIVLVEPISFKRKKITRKVGFFAISAPYIDKMVTVSEESIAIAILRLIEMEKAVVEGAGAAGIAAVLSGMVPELEGKK